MVDGASSSSVTLIAGAVYEALIREDCLKGGSRMKGRLGEINGGRRQRRLLDGKCYSS